jgi:iron(III) transport system substrate-binding protein
MRSIARSVAARASRRWILPALCALALAACGGSPSTPDDAGRETSEGLEDALSAVEGLGVEERRAELLERARDEEGPVRLYATLNIELLQPLADVFEEETGIAVEVFETNAEGLLQRVDQEGRAGVSRVDVIETGGPEMYAMAADGVFAEVTSPHQEQLPEGSVQQGWTTTRFNQYVVAWNTDGIDDDERPRSWEELADPRWDGRVAIDGGPGGVMLYKTLRDHWIEQGVSEEEVERVFRGLASKSRVTSSVSLTTELLGAGEYDVAAGSTTIGHIMRAEGQGAAIAYEPVVEPIVRLRMGAGVVRDAPSPAGALLFHDFLISDGQELYSRFRFDPAREDLQTVPDAEEAVVDLDGLAAEQAALAERWDRLAGLGRAVEEPE